MDEDKAKQLAELLDGDVWDSGFGTWLVVKERSSDGKIVAFSDEVVCVYADHDELQTGQPEESITIV